MGPRFVQLMLCDIEKLIFHDHSQEDLEDVQHLSIVISRFYRELGPIRLASLIATDKANGLCSLIQWLSQTIWPIYNSRLNLRVFKQSQNFCSIIDSITSQGPLEFASASCNPKHAISTIIVAQLYSCQPQHVRIHNYIKYMSRIEVFHHPVDMNSAHALIMITDQGTTFSQ